MDNGGEEALSRLEPSPLRHPPYLLRDVMAGDVEHDGGRLAPVGPWIVRAEAGR
jgi:hypothetical protein